MEGNGSYNDVEPAPVNTRNPKPNMSILYFNARSLLHNIDDLRVICTDKRPDLICIVETWLCSDISDNEIAIPDYTIHRLDRNRRGGGILVYTHYQVIAHVLPNYNPTNLEFMVISVRNHVSSQKLHLALFYRPPNSPYSIFDELQVCLENLSVDTLQQFVLLGDFNVDMLKPSHPLFSHLQTIADYFALTQAVSSPTHSSHNGNSSLIDLVFISCPDRLHSCETVPPLGSSDHLGVHLALKRSITRNAPLNQRTIWRYKYADYEKAAERLNVWTGLMYSLATWIQQLRCGKNGSSTLWCNAFQKPLLPHIQTYLGYRMNSKKFFVQEIKHSIGQNALVSQTI